MHYICTFGRFKQTNIIGYHCFWYKTPMYKKILLGVGMHLFWPCICSECPRYSDALDKLLNWQVSSHLLYCHLRITDNWIITHFWPPGQLLQYMIKITIKCCIIVKHHWQTVEFELRCLNQYALYGGGGGRGCIRGSWFLFSELNFSCLIFYKILDLQ